MIGWRTGFALALAAHMTGCGAVNPYRSHFQCPPLEDGKCVSVGEAYDEALGVGPEYPPLRACPEKPEEERPCGPCPNGPECGDEWCEDVAAPIPEPCEEPPEPPPPPPSEAYRDALYRRLATLVQEPETPLVIPPEVLRVWLLPYEGEGGELFMERHVYVMVEKPRWVLGPRLAGDGGE